MRISLKYLAIATLALCSLSCQKSDVEQSETLSSEQGVLSVACSFSQTRSEQVGSVVTDNSTLKLYNADGELIRYYAPATSTPEDIYLVAGDYRVDVEAGEIYDMTLSIDSLKYSASESFTIEAQRVNSLDVICTMENVAAGIAFDSTIAKNFDDGFEIYFAASSESLGEDIVLVDNIRFDEDGVGYFYMPEGVSSIAWWFYGQSSDPDIADGGVLSASGLIEGVERATLYELSAKYSLSADGDFGLSITIDESSVDSDLPVSFSPKPTITGMDELDVTAQYVNSSRSSSVSFSVVGLNELSSVSVDAGLTSGELLSPFQDGAEVDLADSGVSYEALSQTQGVLTIDAKLFENSAWGEGGARDVVIYATDVAKATATLNWSTYASGFVGEPVVDLWLNSGEFSSIITLDQSEVSSVELRLYDSENDEWGSAVDCTLNSDGTCVGRVEASWRDVVYSGVLTGVLDAKALDGGIFASNSYRYGLFLNGETTPIREGNFTTADGHTIPYGTMENSSLPCFTTSGSSSTSWASGNNSNASSLCKHDTDSDNNGYAVLTSANAVGNLATGNIFMGIFNMGTFTGDACFGQPFTWESRPRAFRFKYRAYLGTINLTGDDFDEIHLSSGEQDNASVRLVIMEWDSRHAVTSGYGTPSNMWNPEKASSFDEGDIIGYASHYITESNTTSSAISSAAFETVEVDILYYDTETKPDATYTLVVQAANSAYGDYMTGCSSNVMHIDDFELVY